MNSLNAHRIKHGAVLSRVCNCGTETVAFVTNAEIEAREAGAFIQDAFPSLTIAEREALFLSGLCGKCWDSMFSDED